MYDNNIGSVVIVDNHEKRNPVGIITERDIVKIIGSLQQMNLQLPIKEHMSHPLITLSLNASIADAMKIMHERKIRRVIILKENNLAGIVTEHDIFKALMKNKDLLSAVVDNSGNLSIPPKNINEELTHFWFNNAFFKQ